MTAGQENHLTTLLFVALDNEVEVSVERFPYGFIADIIIQELLGLCVELPHALVGIFDTTVADGEIDQSLDFVR